AREADRVALPLVQRQYLFHQELVFTAIPEIVLIENLGLLPPRQGRESHGTRAFSIPLAHHARITIRDATNDKLIQVRALPAHHALHDAVELHQRGLTRDLHPTPDRRLTPLQGDFELIHDTCRCPRCPSHVLSSCTVTTRVSLLRGRLFQSVVMDGPTFKASGNDCRCFVIIAIRCILSIAGNHPDAVAAVAGFLPTTTLDTTNILLSRLLWPRGHHGL